MNSPQVRCHKSATSEDKVASESELKIVIALSTESIFLNKIFYLNIILICYYDKQSKKQQIQCKFHLLT